MSFPWLWASIFSERESNINKFRFPRTPEQLTLSDGKGLTFDCKRSPWCTYVADSCFKGDIVDGLWVEGNSTVNEKLGRDKHQSHLSKVSYRVSAMVSFSLSYQYQSDLSNPAALSVRLQFMLLFYRMIVLKTQSSFMTMVSWVPFSTTPCLRLLCWPLSTHRSLSGLLTPSL